MKDLLTKAEAAELLRISQSTLDRIVSDGDLTAYRIRGQMRYKRSDVDAYLNRCKIPARPVMKLKQAPRDTTNSTGYYPGMKVVSA